jgi:hypothetical protein
MIVSIAKKHGKTPNPLLKVKSTNSMNSMYYTTWWKVAMNSWTTCHLFVKVGLSLICMTWTNNIQHKVG